MASRGVEKASVADAVTVAMGRRFLAFEAASVLLAVSLGILSSLSVLSLVWLPFFIILFGSAGRFYRALDFMLGWPSLFLFVVTWIIPALISRSIWASGIFPYLAGFLLAETLDRAEGRPSDRAARRTRIFLVLLFAYAVILLALTFYSSANNPFLWVSIAPFAVLAWGLPRLNKKDPRSTPSKLVVLGLGICLLALAVASATVLYIGPSTTPLFASGLIVLSLLILIEGAYSSAKLPITERRPL